MFTKGPNIGQYDLGSLMAHTCLGTKTHAFPDLIMGGGATRSTNEKLVLF